MTALEERDKILKSIGIRLTLLAESGDEGLDKTLSKLRQALRNNADHLELNRLSDNLMKASLGKDDHKDDLQIDDFFKRLSQALKGLKVEDSELGQTINSLSEDLVAGKSLSLRLVVLKETFSSIVKLHRQHAVKSRPKTKSAWLSLGKGKKQEDAEWFAEFFSDVIVLLDHVLEHLLSLNDNNEKVLGIKDNLQELESVEQVEQVLESVLELLGDITQQVRSERIATQAFLGDMRGKLRTIEEVVSQVGDSNGDFYERALDFSNGISKNVGEIGKEVEETTDLATLRQSLGSKIDLVSDSVTDYVTREREYNESYQEQVNKLTSKIQRMEDEAESLRMAIRERNELAVKDTLTGVYNRAGFEERMEEEFARSKRSERQLSLIFVDCNEFKIINDTFGHAAGDVVLKKVAEVLKKRARVSDVVGRYGGDEFVILLPETSVDGAVQFAKAAAQKVLEAGFNAGGKPLDVSISCGVTEVKPEDDEKSALERADQAMYQAKGMSGEKVFMIS